MSLSAINAMVFKMYHWALMHLKKCSVTNAGCRCLGFGQPHQHISRGMDGRARADKAQNPLISLYPADDGLGL